MPNLISTILLEIDAFYYKPMHWVDLNPIYLKLICDFLKYSEIRSEVMNYVKAELISNLIRYFEQCCMESGPSFYIVHHI